MPGSIEFLLQQSVALATPIALAALGETLIECSGVFHLCLEGTMLVGAFAGTLGSWYFGSAAAGVACAVLAALVFELIFSIVILRFRADEVITGASMNLLAAGSTALLWRATLGLSGSHAPIATFPQWRVPLLSEIPILGPLLFQHHVLTYFTILTAAALWVFLQKTGAGLRLRACGEFPAAARALGLHPARTRLFAILAGGTLAGIAGASLSLAEAGTFVDEMTAGRGFVAIALVIFGAHHALGAAAASIFFGLALAFQFRLQAGGYASIPPELFRSLPYLLSLLVLAGFAGRRRAPSALGKGIESQY